MAYYDPQIGEWVEEPSPTPDRPSQMDFPDYGGYGTQPNRPLMGMYSNAAPPAVASEPAYGGDLRRVTDPLSGAGYASWPTDAGKWVRSPNTGYADMGDPNQATGLADWMARNMARAGTDPQARGDLLQFLQARDPMAFMSGQVVDRHTEPSSYPGAPRTIPWTADMMRPPTVTDGGAAPPPEQAPAANRRPTTEAAPLAPVGSERVNRELPPAQAQPDTQMRQSIADAYNEDAITAAITGQAQPVGMTEPDTAGNRYQILGELRSPTGGAGGRIVNVNGQLLIYDPQRGYVSLNDPEYAKYLTRRVQGQGRTRYQGYPNR